MSKSNSIAEKPPTSATEPAERTTVSDPTPPPARRSRRPRVSRPDLGREGEFPEASLRAAVLSGKWTDPLHRPAWLAIPSAEPKETYRRSKAWKVIGV